MFLLRMSVVDTSIALKGTMLDCSGSGAVEGFSQLGGARKEQEALDLMTREKSEASVALFFRDSEFLHTVIIIIVCIL